MKRIHQLQILMAILFSLSLGSCKDDTDPEPSGTETSDWDMDMTVDLGGEFNVKADVHFDLKETTFEAEVKTTEIAGQVEEHTTIMTGSRNGNVLTVENQIFNVTPPGGSEEKVTLKQGEITLNGSNLTGSGTMEVDFQDGSDPVAGSFTATGSKK